MRAEGVMKGLASLHAWIEGTMEASFGFEER